MASHSLDGMTLHSCMRTRNSIHFVVSIWPGPFARVRTYLHVCHLRNPEANVSLRTAGSMNSQNYTRAGATCAAYRSHLCDPSEAESFVANIAMGSSWVAWGAKGCTLEAAKKNWACGDVATQANEYDALCCLDQARSRPNAAGNCGTQITSESQSSYIIMFRKNGA